LSTEGMPDFLVIGAYKSGTTTVHHALRAHPAIFLPSRTEPTFFAFQDAGPDTHPQARESIRDVDAYRALFRPAPAEALRGEVSPAYLAHPAACANIARHAPDARLVAVLRHPVERAYSDYLMYVRDGLEPYTDFGRALDEQDERRLAGLPTGYYVSTGYYGAQLEPYYERFGRERVLVLLFEDLTRDLRSGMRQIYRFLGVDEDVEPPVDGAFNVSGVPRGPAVRAAMRFRRAAAPLFRPVVPQRAKHAVDRALQRRLDRPPLLADDRARLLEAYHQDIDRLEVLIGRDLSAWKR
jgi:hypothetical protein